MKKYLLFIVLIVIGFACAGGEKKNNNKKTAGIDTKKLYKTNCVLCHGVDGKLGVNNSKDLTLSTLTKAERIQIISKGKGAMTGFETLLNKDEIAALASYTFKL